MIWMMILEMMMTIMMMEVMMTMMMMMMMTMMMMMEISEVFVLGDSPISADAQGSNFVTGVITQRRIYWL